VRRNLTGATILITHGVNVLPESEQAIICDRMCAFDDFSGITTQSYEEKTSFAKRKGNMAVRSLGTAIWKQKVAPRRQR
jgi:hypothetical protein